MNRLRSPLMLAGLLLMLVTTARAELPVQPFEAHYTVYAKGIEAGEGSITLTDAGEGRYRMSSHLRATGLVRLILRDTIAERSEGRVVDANVRPISYRFERSGGSREEINDYDFDWNHGVVRARHNEHRTTLELEPRVADPLSLYLQVMTNLTLGRRVENYRLLDDAELKTYRVEYHGRETLRTPLGELTVLRVSRQRPGSSRRVVFWFAADYDYLPVQITQYKDGSENLRMMIRELQRGPSRQS